MLNPGPLGIALTACNAGPALDAALRALDAALAPEDQLVAIDLGSTDRTADRLAEFCDPRGALLIRLDTTTLTHCEALALAAAQCDAPWLMALDASDRLCAGPLDRLRQRLADSDADLAVLDSAYWLTSPGHPLPRADAARVAALPAAPAPDDLTGLCPDPRRLAVARGFLDRLEPRLTPWRAWAQALAQAGPVLFQPGPVILFPLPESAPAPDWGFLAEEIAAAPAPDRAARLAARLLWADEALLHTPPEAAAALIEGAAGFARALPRPLRRAARAQPGPMGGLLAALHRGGRTEALAHLALVAAGEQRRATRALAGEYARLRADLDLALPGPDYLADLYARIRGL